MTLEEAEQWIAEQEFVYAKSYSDTFPHHYTTRSRCDQDKFEAFLQLIRIEGIVKSFFKKQYLYLELGEYEYWEMGRPIPAVQVLNRATINDDADYRHPPPSEYDAELLKNKLASREQHLAFLLRKAKVSPEEITPTEQRKIAFLMDSKRRIHGGGKNIIDHATVKLRYE